ncbi:uncharacterized protein LY79DRAFT_399069 [Colletotrichum navitas]|uniref:Uncharacterized protein n=1 Tax=Colletotrichum navitas TaxID=681940 RepID=A0AAD8PQD8_9PEZI|nr:uncharacterized protein LY79DRAFT_399069 [Colletotrichum navitas]KAK1573773.1 hypothetical protein LY79DRAFT_399069 [Colletotrichum navitas]
MTSVAMEECNGKRGWGEGVDGHGVLGPSGPSIYARYTPYRLAILVYPYKYIQYIGYYVPEAHTHSHFAWGAMLPILNVHCTLLYTKPNTWIGGVTTPRLNSQCLRRAESSAGLDYTFGQDEKVTLMVRAVAFREMTKQGASRRGDSCRCSRNASVPFRWVTNIQAATTRRSRSFLAFPSGTLPGGGGGARGKGGGRAAGATAPGPLRILKTPTRQALTSGGGPGG